MFLAPFMHSGINGLWTWIQKPWAVWAVQSSRGISGVNCVSRESTCDEIVVFPKFARMSKWLSLSAIHVEAVRVVAIKLTEASSSSAIHVEAVRVVAIKLTGAGSSSSFKQSHSGQCLMTTLEHITLCYWLIRNFLIDVDNHMYRDILIEQCHMTVHHLQLGSPQLCHIHFAVQ